MDPLSLFGSIFGGAIGGIAANGTRIAFDWWTERVKRERIRSNLALRIAIQLEGYAVTCASIADDHRLATEHHGQTGSFIITIPEVATYPESDAAQFLDLDLLDAVFGLPQRRQMAQDIAAAERELSVDPDDDRSGMHRNTIRMGCEALEIAQRLRTRYGLEQRALRFGHWDVESYLGGELERLTRAAQGGAKPADGRNQQIFAGPSTESD